MNRDKISDQLYFGHVYCSRTGNEVEMLHYNKENMFTRLSDNKLIPVNERLNSEIIVQYA